MAPGGPEDVYSNGPLSIAVKEGLALFVGGLYPGHVPQVDLPVVGAFTHHHGTQLFHDFLLPGHFEEVLALFPYDEAVGYVQVLGSYGGHDLG